LYNESGGFGKEKHMETFINANVAYLLLILGFILVFLALVTPGTHLMEGGALLLLFLAGLEVINLGFNWWALVIMLLSLVPFIYAIRKPKQRWVLAVAILLLIAGSLYLFPGEGFAPAVNPALAVVVSLFTAGFLWISVDKGLNAIRSIPVQDPETLVGKVGQARTEIGETGSVQVASELWSARSADSIPAGSQVRVVRREGFTLVVEPQDQSK
jgi:membrane-bound serine protease (ClpP class)